MSKTKYTNRKVIWFYISSKTRNWGLWIKNLDFKIKQQILWDLFYQIYTDFHDLYLFKRKNIFVVCITGKNGND